MKRWCKLSIVFCFLIFSCQRNERGLVVGKIKNAAKLATTEFTVDKVVHGSKQKKLAWVINLNESKFLAYSQAKIKAGVDLEKLRDGDVKLDLISRKISIELPAVQVLNFSYPAESFKKDTLISDDAFMNAITLDDQELFFREAELDIRSSLEYMNIREITEKNTRKLMEGMLKTLGYTEIYITFRKDVPLIQQVNPEL